MTPALRCPFCRGTIEVWRTQGFCNICGRSFPLLDASSEGDATPTTAAAVVPRKVAKGS